MINVARGGMLVESDVRLTPGAGVCLNVALGDQVYQVAGRVSRVDASLADGRVKYRAGIALDQEMAIFDLPSLPETSAADAEADRALDTELQERLQPPVESETAVALRAELNELRLEVQQQREAGAALRQAVDSGEAARRQLIDAQAAERTRWADDRKLLQERASENEEQAATLARKIRSVVEAQRDQAEQHALEKSRLEAEANEATQQLTELRAVHASLLATILAASRGFRTGTRRVAGRAPACDERDRRRRELEQRPAGPALPRFVSRWPRCFRCSTAARTCSARGPSRASCRQGSPWRRRRRLTPTRFRRSLPRWRRSADPHRPDSTRPTCSTRLHGRITVPSRLRVVPHP